MVHDRIASTFVVVFSMLFGLLSGAWIFVGKFPGKELFFGLDSLIRQYQPATVDSFLFWMIPFMVVLLAYMGSYYYGGLIGVTAATFGLASGYFMESAAALIMLIVAILLSLIAPYWQPEEHGLLY